MTVKTARPLCDGCEQGLTPVEVDQRVTVVECRITYKEDGTTGRAIYCPDCLYRANIGWDQVESATPIHD
jgi:hypothetical protein